MDDNLFLNTPSFLIREEAAIKDLLTVSEDTRAGGQAEGAHLHIVHLSDARSSLELIKVIFPSFPWLFIKSQ